MALHEYDEALVELKESLKSGHDAGEVHYALGLVLGKHYERAMYEARLAGGGEWAEKQLKSLEEKYLKGAIESLQRSRGVKSESGKYLEALIAYYRREYEKALEEAKAAEQASPWLYEAKKLAGDVHVERALKARDSGKYEEAEREFEAGVRRYEEAALIGESASEVYEGLAEAWVRTIEMEAGRGKETEKAYRAAIAAGDKATAAEPERVMGRLKKGYASLLRSMTVGTGASSGEQVKECIAEMEKVIEKEPENPYARDVAGGCLAIAADAAQGRGENPEPQIRRAIELLERAVQKNPRFLWGLNDLAGCYLYLGTYLQLHGKAGAQERFEQTLQYETKAVELDGTYLVALQNILFANARLVSYAKTEEEVDGIVGRAKGAEARCSEVNGKYQQCHINYLSVLARAGERKQLGGASAERELSQAKERIGTIQKIGGTFLDGEQNAALVELQVAQQALKKKESPSAALEELGKAVARCLAISEKDAMCRTLRAQGEWVRAEWEEQQGGTGESALREAVKRAKEATESPEAYPDGWWTLAESHRRLLEKKGVSEKERKEHEEGVRKAVSRCLGINGNHGMCHVTLGRMELKQSRESKESEDRRKHGAEAAKELEAGLKADGLLLTRYGAELTEAQTLARGL